MTVDNDVLHLDAERLKAARRGVLKRTTQGCLELFREFGNPLQVGCGFGKPADRPLELLVRGGQAAGEALGVLGERAQSLPKAFADLPQR